MLRGERQHAVIAPVTVTGELAKGHQFDGRHAQRRQPRQLFDHLGVTAHKADVDFVDHRLMPGPALPMAVLPRVGSRIDDLAGTVHAFGLKARRRVGHLQFAVDAIAIATASRRRPSPAEPAIGPALQRQAPVGQQADLDAVGIGCPQREAHGVAVEHHGPVGRELI
ncbi:hypothetical protein D3C79_803450 [compost metagenome]